MNHAQSLHLTGILSYVDKYGRLKFVFAEDDSRAKLIRHCAGTCLPYSDTEFTVTLTRSGAPIPQDIQECMGLLCAIEVKLSPYRFASRLAHNRGQTITGIKLTLLDFHRL